MNRKQGRPSRTPGLPPLPPRNIGSSSGTRNLPVRLAEENQPNRTIPTPDRTIPSHHDLSSAVKELSKLNTKQVGKLIANAENGILQQTKTDGTVLEISVEGLARYLARHIIKYLSNELDDEYLSHLLSGVRLLHILCDIASHSPKLKQVLFEDVYVGKEILDLIFSMMTYLSNLGTKIQGSSVRELLYSTLLANSLYLLKSFISSEFKIITPVLLAHREVDRFTKDGLKSVGVVISFLQVNLSAIITNSRLKSKSDEVQRLFQTCEASLQFFQSLCKQRKFREHLYVTKVGISDPFIYEWVNSGYVLPLQELLDVGVVLQLVQDILKLPQCKDSHLMDVVYRLKSKVLYIMFCLCEVENSSFLESCSDTTESLELACTTVYEVLKVVKMMFNGDFQDHPRSLLGLNAMRITEILSDDSNFRAYIVLNLTEALTKVFTLQEKIFLSSWCSSDPEPAEKDIVKDYDSLEISGQVLVVGLETPSKAATLRAFSPLEISYARQRSGLLVKTVAHLSCIVPNLSQEENGHFVREFLDCMEKEISNLPDAAAHGGGEIIASLGGNLRSVLCYAQSLIPQYLNEKDADTFGLFYSQVEQGPDLHRVKEVDNRGQSSSPTATLQRSSPDGNVQMVTRNEGVSLNLPVAQLQNHLNGAATEDRRENGAEAVNEEEIVEKKRKRHTMSRIQITMIESAVNDDPDLQWRSAELKQWAAELSRHGPEVTLSELRKWLRNRRAKHARAMQENLPTLSQVNNVSTGTQNNPPESSANELPLSSSPPHGTHQNDVLRICGPERSQALTISTPTNNFKRGQNVRLINGQGEEIGTGCIQLANGTWCEINLKESGLCVVDVNDLKVDARSDVPHPCATVKTFRDVERSLGKMSVLWEVSKLHLI